MDIRFYLIPLGVMSFFALIAFGVDKWKAVRDGKRVPELTLLSLAALGGSAGAVIGSLLFRHKTNFRRKPHFFFTLYGSFVLHVGLLIWLLLRSL